MADPTGCSGSEEHPQSTLPRIVWALWFQGEENAPEIVRCCLASWRRLNPGWRVVVLDRGTLAHYADVGLPEPVFAALGVQMQANLVRLALLQRHGGVWADATTLCARPLDEFIHDLVAPSGFFAFTNASRERLLSNWFLAARPQHPIVAGLRARLIAYFSAHPPRPRSPRWQRLLHKAAREVFKIHPAATRLWLRRPVIALTGRYPYFLFHYTFADLLARDRPFRDLWSRTPRRLNRPGKALSRLALRPAVDAAAAAALADAASGGLFKLSWKNPAVAAIPAGTLLAQALAPYRAGSAAEG
ncbi:MAG: capsular polysaccharide synthesis protein [Cyanobium sp. Prado107]|nr:capsular polysaccharide synthesis protein [Cyanobium sp. Prado107]